MLNFKGTVVSALVVGVAMTAQVALAGHDDNSIKAKITGSRSSKIRLFGRWASQ